MIIKLIYIFLIILATPQPEGSTENEMVATSNFLTEEPETSHELHSLGWGLDTVQRVMTLAETLPPEEVEDKATGLLTGMHKESSTSYFKLPNVGDNVHDVDHDVSRVLKQIWDVCVKEWPLDHDLGLSQADTFRYLHLYYAYYLDTCVLYFKNQMDTTWVERVAQLYWHWRISMAKPPGFYYTDEFFQDFLN